MKKQESDAKFDARFTAGGLLHHEFKSLKPLLTNPEFLVKIETEREENRFINIPTLAARKRIIQEIVARYNSAPENFWDYFFDWNEREQKLGLYHLCLVTYPLFMDLHQEVVQKKHQTGEKVDAFDISMRLDVLASKHANVAQWTAATLNKVNSRFRSSLEDAGLVKDGKPIQPQEISNFFWGYFQSVDRGWFLPLCFYSEK